MKPKNSYDMTDVLKSPYKRPQFYTEKEGGNWIDWPSGTKFDYGYLYRKCLITKTVKMDNLLVHSLAFGHVAAGIDSIIRWDCINGFTDIPEKVIY